MKKTFLLFALAFLLVGFSQTQAQTPAMLNTWWRYVKVDFGKSNQMVCKSLFEDLNKNIGGKPFKFKFEENPDYDFQWIYEESQNVFRTVGGKIGQAGDDKYAFMFSPTEQFMAHVKLSGDNQQLYLSIYGNEVDFLTLVFEKEEN